jgi:hypothetical protein
MPEDPHLFKGEGERRRRYGRLLIDPKHQQLRIFEHDSFFQDKKFDELYGDIDRNFAPMTEEEYNSVFLHMLVLEGFRVFPMTDEQRIQPFEVSVHMIRIEATPCSTLGRPAPEGIHRDGYHFGAIHLMRRTNVSGAVNNFYDLQKTLIDQKVLQKPMDSVYFDDSAIYHAVSPFEQEDPSKQATRDVLILLYQPLSESPQKAGDTKLLRYY